MNRRTKLFRPEALTQCLLHLEKLERRDLMAADMLGVVRGSTWLFDTSPGPMAEVDRSYGFSSDRMVAGKWTGTTDMMGAIRPGSDGLLHWLLDTNGDQTHDIDIAYGFATDQIMAGDWDGDGRDNVGVVRQGGDGLLHWLLDTDGDPSHEIDLAFGLPGDVPVAGDWNADGRDDVGVVRPGGNGLLQWYLNLDDDALEELHYEFGLNSGHEPIVGDWDGDGRENMGVTTPGADGLLHWLLAIDDDKWADQELAYGFPSDSPMVGEWQYAEIEVVGAPNNPSGLFGTIDIGSVPQGAAQGPTATFNVRNPGNAWLAIGQVHADPGIKILDPPTIALPPGMTDTLTVCFDDTTTPGVRSGRIWIDNADGGESPYFIQLAATVAGAEIDVSEIENGQTGVSFGTATVGSIANKEFVVRNLGVSALTLGSVQVPTGFTLVKDLPSSIEPGAVATFVLQMDTTTPGIRSGYVTFTSSDMDEATYSFEISGQVTQESAGTPTDPLERRSPSYQPLKGSGINLSIERGLLYSPGVDRRKLVTVEVHVENPNRAVGDYKISLWWTNDVNNRRSYVSAGTKIFTVDRNFPRGTQFCWFAEGEATRQPAGKRYLVAIVNPAGDVPETSYRDNGMYLDVQKKQSYSLPNSGINPPARTFVYLLSGFGLSGDASGMQNLGNAIRASGLATEVTVFPSYLTGQSMLRDAQVTVDRQLLAAGVTSADRVIIIGHSFGGDAARRLAADIRLNVRGKQPATALVTIDPIDYLAVNGTQGTDQSGRHYSVPSGISSKNVLNIVQRNRNVGIPIFGYIINGARTVTRTNVTHTTVDDDQQTQQLVVDFLHGLPNRR